MPAHLLPRVSTGIRRPAGNGAPQLLPKATTPAELLENLDRAITASPPLGLSQAVAHHAAHLPLATTASFNLLIRYAVRNASFGTVQRLLGQMVREAVSGD